MKISRKNVETDIGTSKLMKIFFFALGYFGKIHHYKPKIDIFSKFISVNYCFNRR